MATRKTPSPFTTETLAFLRALEKNNRREWFEPRKERYEAEVREPALAFIRQMEREVKRISPSLVALAKKAGGSLMRPYRDTRFSKDKRPYKTNIGIQFRHVAGKDVHAPGLYVHVEPGRCFLGAGMWRPDSDALRAIREAIDSDPKSWKRASGGKRFRSVWQPAGESLKRPPRGYAEDHPAIDDLKRKDHIAVCELRDADVVAAGFAEAAAARFHDARPYVGWLADAVGLPL